MTYDRRLHVESVVIEPCGTGHKLRLTPSELETYAMVAETFPGAECVEVTAREQGEYGKWRTRRVRRELPVLPEAGRACIDAVLGAGK